jgi:hypothetical protein
VDQFNEVFASHPLSVVVHHRFAKQLEALLLLPTILQIACVLAEYVKLDELESIIVFLLDELELQIGFSFFAFVVGWVKLRVELENPLEPLVF